MIGSYSYDQLFQRKLLALLLQEPDRVLDLIEPQYFGSPIHVEVARVVSEAYRKHGTQDFRLARSTVMELVKAGLTNDDVLPAYKAEIKKLFNMGISDAPILAEHAREFAKEQRYREALIRAEKHVTNHNYERAHEIVEEAQAFVDGSMGANSGMGGDNLTWETLPRFDPKVIKKTKWLVEHFIAEHTISLVYGPRGSFKSTFLLAMAGAVAKGEEFLGMDTRCRRVLYLDYENPPDVIRNRNLDLDLNLPDNKRLVVWDRFGGQSPPRPGEAKLERFVAHCVKVLHRKPWVILDSWASLLRTGEGGETTGQIAPIYMRIRHLCDLGATFTIIDHTRKYEGGTIYGGQDKEAKADTIHNFVIHENRVRKENPIIRIESWLKRYAPQGFGTFAAEVQSFQDEKEQWHISGFEVVGDPKVEERKKTKELLCDLIRENPNISQRKLAKLAAAHGIGRDKAEERLKAGIGKHWTVSEGAKGRLSYRLLDEEES